MQKVRRLGPAIRTSMMQTTMSTQHEAQRENERAQEGNKGAQEATDHEEPHDESYEEVASCFAQKRDRPSELSDVLEADDADRYVAGRPDCSVQPGGSFGKEDQASRTGLQQCSEQPGGSFGKDDQASKLIDDDEIAMMQQGTTVSQDRAKGQKSSP